MHFFPFPKAKANVTMTLSLNYFSDETSCDKAVWTVTLCINDKPTSSSGNHRCSLYDNKVYLQPECVSVDKRPYIHFAMDDVLSSVDISITATNYGTRGPFKLQTREMSVITRKDETFSSDDNRLYVL
ncbi:hypothetical protein Ciccas_002830 [Cichlidogyrus casuarinus]|uniref:Uncharacterized protein n=1 Tax=Cichlidogyrus casuarinus TaxID=1844966 RepID=A0ABD2QG52_9PLAT